MSERVTECPKSIAMALVKAQQAVKAVAKDSTNSFHKYKYASSDDMVSEARRALTTVGLSLARIGWTEQPVTEHAPARLHVLYMLTSAEGECMMLPPVSVPVLPEKGRPEDKAEAAALTYSHGYLVLGLLQMARVDENDVDARDDSSRDVRPRPQAAPQKDPRGSKNIDDAKDGKALYGWCKEWGRAATEAKGAKAVAALVSAAALRCAVDVPTALEWAGLPKNAAVARGEDPDA